MAIGLAETGVARFLVIVAQLGLLLLVIHLFQVEESFGFLRITPLIFVGFVIHAVLPLRLRLPFFLFLSLAAIATIFSFPHNIGLIGIGLILIGICHLPLPYAMRVCLLAASGIVLAAFRAEWIETPWTQLPTLILPVLGSMFMFRLIIYMYDLHHQVKPGTLWERLSYFFLLPNVCFPLFPVIDYQTYRRTYYDAAPHEIYQKGLRWILRGVTHLLIYRLVYFHVLPSPAAVQDLGGVVQYVVATYLLYLRISGQFHLIVGILCLFGFNLPATHHLYYLASSFNDFWRRINIYWKDFMMKILFYPTFMRLRRLGMKAALTVATLIVFAGTWLLHSYQWFWLQGVFPLTAPDALFWGILGVFVVFNSLREAGQGRKRLGNQGWAWRPALRHSLSTVGMFVLLATLWSLWSSASVGEWWSLVSLAGASAPGDFVVLLLVLALLIGIGVAVQYALHQGWRMSAISDDAPFAHSAAFTGSAALLLALVGSPGLMAAVSGQGSAWVASIQEDRLNEQDSELVNRGYYEHLLDADRYTSALWRVQSKPRDWKEPVGQRTDDILISELVPSYSGITKRAPFQTNRWGMADREYDQQKRDGTYRIAMLGASYEMGAGVERSQTFEAVLEDRLNRTPPLDSPSRYEILNFAVGGYSVVQSAVVADRKIWSFDPDAILFAVHSTEDIRLMTHLRKVVQSGVPVPYPELRQLLTSTGVQTGMSEREIHRRLTPILDDVIAWSFRMVAEMSAARGVQAALVFVPTTEEIAGVDSEQLERLSGLGRAAGLTMLNLEGAYGSYAAESIQLAPWDFHLSVEGHRLVGERLHQVLREHPALLAPRPGNSLETATLGN